MMKGGHYKVLSQYIKKKKSLGQIEICPQVIIIFIFGTHKEPKSGRARLFYLQSEECPSF